MTTKTEAQEPKLAHTPANQFFDECECYFELPLGGKIEDATEFLSGYDEEVRLAACAFAEAYAEKRLEVAAAPELLEAAKSGAHALRNALIQALDVGLYDSAKEWREAIDNHPTLKALNAATAKATRAEGTL